MSRNEIDLKTDWHWEWRVNGHVAMRQAARFDVLCFGDSLINHGLVPPILETRLGKRVYNLSLSGGQSSTSYIQLRRALDAGARPAAVIVDFFPLLLNHGYEENEPRWPDLLTPRECLDLAWMVRDASFFARMMLARHLPSLRERTSLRAHLLAALGGKGGSERLGALAYQRNWRLNHGTSVFAKAEKLKLGDMDAWYRAAFRNPEWCAPYHAAYLVRFLELAAARDIPVFWLVPPIHPEAQRRFDKGGTEARYDQLLRSALHRFPKVVVIDARRARYDASVFVDQAHLDRQGASVLSRRRRHRLPRSGRPRTGGSLDRPASLPAPVARLLDRGHPPVAHDRAAPGGIGPALRRPRRRSSTSRSDGATHRSILERLTLGLRTPFATRPPQPPPS